MNTASASASSAPPKLRVELVPSTCWLSNVRSYMSDHFWRKLSQEIAEESERRCQVCRGRGRRHAVECHEAWLYDDARRVQTLLRLEALCPMCHAIKHLGRTIARGKEDMALYWLGKVNGWDERATRGYVDAVFAQWSVRSRVEWTLDLRVLGEVYDVPLGRLGLESFVLHPAQRRQMQHGRAMSVEDVYQRDGTAVR